MIQKSLVLMKPDAVKRGIVGEILARFERAGLKIVGAKLTVPTRELSQKHYNKDDAWKLKIGNIRLDECKKHNLNPKDIYGTDNPLEMGNLVNESNHDYLTSGPVLALVFEGMNAVDKIRNLVGPTYTLDAPAGTIRGDYGSESPYSSLIRGRTIYNFIHATGAADESDYEVSLWFNKDELVSYKHAHQEFYQY